VSQGPTAGTQGNDCSEIRALLGRTKKRQTGVRNCVNNSLMWFIAESDLAQCRSRNATKAIDSCLQVRSYSQKCYNKTEAVIRECKIPSGYQFCHATHCSSDSCSRKLVGSSPKGRLQPPFVLLRFHCFRQNPNKIALSPAALSAPSALSAFYCALVVTGIHKLSSPRMKLRMMN
jgi:hypothetical protein